MRELWTAVNSRRRLLQAVLAGLVFPRTAWPAPPAIPEVARHAVALGRTTVHLVVSERAPGDLSFVSVHEDEHTAVTAARQLLAQHPGRLVELRSGGRRLVTFWLGATPHVVDPNRIFTDAGIERSLRRYGSYTRAAHQAVAGLREAILGLLPPRRGAPVVALHNNAARDYTLDQYRPGGTHASDAETVVVNPRQTSAAFFLVTTSRLFECLRATGYNVVLQSRSPADDGSLSVWFQQHARPYITVEARHGALDEQFRMLETVLDVAGRSEC